MRPVTTRLPDDTHRTLKEQAEAEDRSISELVREHVEKGLEYDDLERENQRLQRQLGMLIEDREERTELVRYASTEKAYREASLGTRMKWWLFGKGED